MLRVVVLLLLCVAIAVLVASAVRSRSQVQQSTDALRALSDTAIELALAHRELDGDRALASLVLKRAVHADDTLANDLLVLAEKHMDTSPGLAWAVADAARAARKNLP